MRDERKTIQEVRQQKTEKIIKQVLDQNYITLTIENLIINENLTEGKTHVECHTLVEGEPVIIDSEGKGMVNALYSGFMKEFSSDCLSLKDIRFKDFRLKIADRKKQTDAHIMAKLTVMNIKNDILIFADKSRSMNASAARAVSKCIEYFINSENAFLVLKDAIKDAQERDRPDLVKRFTSQLAEIVKNTSYKKIIK